VVGWQEPHDPGWSSEHSKVAEGSFEEKAKSASVLTLGSGGATSMLVSGTTAALPLAMAKGYRMRV
jgi:hypothetical protein